LVRSDQIPGYQNQGPLYEWSAGKAYLTIDKIKFSKKSGALLCYYNPPVHQVGNPGLDAFLEGLDKVLEKRNAFEYLILYGANDPVHAGGDLKESLVKLDKTLDEKRGKEKSGASADEIDRLYEWADNRLKKGIGLHARLRSIADSIRVVAVCGGGTRYGGSAEIPLMADYLVGDSRSGMCFSEAMIGLIPGWSGIARSIIKAGSVNTEYMAKTTKEIKANELKGIGIYDAVVEVPFPFPKREKTDDPDADKKNYLDALEAHNDAAGRLLLPKGLELGTCSSEKIPKLDENDRSLLATEAQISQEVERRVDPKTYSHLWGKLLREVKDEVSEIGRPLAPQSIDALNELLDGYDPSSFDEKSFVQKEMKADAGLYRDMRFRAGLIATLEQRVADYREAK
jgi:enoyl-CoA hydratase/carnithine racemase